MSEGDSFHQEAPISTGVVDNRPRAFGLGRIVMAIYWVFGIWVTVCALIDLFSHRSGPLGPLLIALVAGLNYLGAALGITHNGKRMRILGWICCGISLAGPVLISLASFGIPEFGEARVAWVGIYFLPIVVALIGLIWMWYSNPRRIVEIAEQVEGKTGLLGNRHK